MPTHGIPTLDIPAYRPLSPHLRAGGFGALSPRAKPAPAPAPAQPLSSPGVHPPERWIAALAPPAQAPAPAPAPPPAQAPPPRPPSPTIPKIPNFGRVLSKEEPAAADGAKGGLSGSLSARQPERPKSIWDTAPLTSRPLGVTPRNRAMLGPRPGREPLLGGLGALGGGAPLNSPRKTVPKSPRGGVPRSPRGRDDVPRSPRGRDDERAAPRGRAADAPPPPRPRSKPAGGDWLAAAVDGGGGAWLPLASGAAVEVRGRPGVLIGAAPGGGGAGGTWWRVRLDGEAEARAVGGGAVRRVPPAKGELARCVLGESRGLEGVVLSTQGGVAVLRATAGGTDERLVRVLPLEALCMLPAASAAERGGGARAFELD